MADDAPSLSRRTVLAGAAGAAASSIAGCSERFWSRAENSAPEQIELTVKTLPTDDDAGAAKILSHFRENLEQAGIAVNHEPVAEPELYRDVLLEGDYDVFVARHPGFDEYDELYGLLHSRFHSERGWQNPFHFSDVTADDYLEQQRRTADDERRAVLGDLFAYLDETVPYTTVAFPDRIGGVHDSITAPSPPRRPVEYLDLLRREPDDGPRDGPLEVGVFGEGLGNRLNPLAVDRNRVDGLLGLLYDPLARRVDSIIDGEGGDDYAPWLAADLSWSDADSLALTVALRDGLTWHDGTDLDADDVAFTFRFLRDTSLGDIDGGLPAPRYRSHATLVEDVEVIDDETVRITFDTDVRAVAERVLSVPILPEHVWEPRSEVIADHQTEALVTDNQEPVGSGLFTLESVSADAIELAPFDDHVLSDETDETDETDGTDEASERPTVLDGFSQFSGLRFRIEPNPGAMIDALLEGEIDVTGDAVPASELEGIRSADEATMITGSTNAFYMIGYNITHHPALGNPHFRRVLSRLIDRDYVVAEFFEGRAEPATGYSSLLGIRDEVWEFDDRSTVATFPGHEGELNVGRVRSLFEDAGYRYEDGELLE